MSIIIVEGCDCSGKTTLAKFIAKQVDGIYFHCDHTKDLEEAMPDYQWSVHQNLVWNLENLGHTIVLDRSWPSEIVYGQVFGPQRRIERSNAKKIQSLLDKHQPRYVHCDCESASVTQLQDPDHPYNMMDFVRIRELYLNLFHHLSKSALITKYDMDEQGHDMHTFLYKNL